MSGTLNAWKNRIVAFAGGLGAPGLFLISFLDSSVLSFPIINDLLLVNLTLRQPQRMPLYAVMAMTGSVLGCVVLYFLAKKGGEAVFHQRAGHRAHAIRAWLERNEFTGILVAALLPPPTPFKIFVLGAGVFEIPVGSFAGAIAVARAIRYFAIGYLAIRYGDLAKRVAEKPWVYLSRYWWQVLAIFIVFISISYLASRVVLRHRPHQTTTT